MLRTLYTKLALVLFLLFLLIGVLVIYVLVFTSATYHQVVTQNLNRDLAQHIIKEQLLFKDGSLDPAGLRQVFHMLMVVNPGIEVYILDADGYVLDFAAPLDKVQRTRVAMEPIQAFLKPPLLAQPVFGDDPRSPTAQKIFSVAPVQLDKDTMGYVYVILSGEQYDSVAQQLQGNYVLKLTSGFVVAGILFASIAAFLIFRSMTRRLRRLSASMVEFQAAGFKQRVDIEIPARLGDEIDQLSTTFHAMVERILAQLEKIQRADTSRRELITNVSHDLRTPLTTLQGYLETLLIKQDVLSPQQCQQYLQVAVQHSQHLAHLVSELFELARLDNLETTIHEESFSLAELMQDVTGKHEPRARERGIQLQTQVASNLPFVCGDIRLIERVLENLIDNALRFTPDGGRITLQAKSAGFTVNVYVSDTGRGIPADSLPRIFDRFYRAGNQGGSTEGGTGLGLAITKRILELHKSTIQAVSELGRGTTFSFYLRAALPA